MQEISSETGFPRDGSYWLSAPDERTPGFLPTFAEISVAIQTVLRARVPSAYFDNLANYRNVKTAYPMLVYQASQPFRGKMRSELTYDVLNPKTVARFFRTAKANLVDLLAAAEARLRRDGLNEVARDYEERKLPVILQAVQKWNKSRKCLYILIRSESVLVNTVVELGGLGSLAPKQQARRVSSFEKKWRFQLRRLYPGTDFTWLAPVLLEAATSALAEIQQRTPAPEVEQALELFDETEPP